MHAAANRDDLQSFAPNYLGYPPTALFYIIPFTFLNWHIAHLLWLLVILAAMILGVAAMADLCMPLSPVLAVAELVFMLDCNLDLISLAQPSTLVIGLCLIAVWSFITGRYRKTGIACFAFSLLFKPHLGALVLLYFLLAGASHRRKALQTIVVTVCLALPGLLWASILPEARNWSHDLSHSLQVNAQKGQLSYLGASNPMAGAFADLQTLIALIRDDPKFFNPVTYAIWLVLFLLWLYPVFKLKAGPGKDYLCVAAASALALLPVYHRFYDARFLLLTFPALALILSSRRPLRIYAVLMATFVTFAICGPWWPQVDRHVAIGCLTAALSYLAFCYVYLFRDPGLPADAVR